MNETADVSPVKSSVVATPAVLKPPPTTAAVCVPNPAAYPLLLANLGAVEKVDPSYDCVSSTPEGAVPFPPLVKSAASESAPAAFAPCAPTNKLPVFAKEVPLYSSAAVNEGLPPANIAEVCVPAAKAALLAVLAVFQAFQLVPSYSKVLFVILGAPGAVAPNAATVAV